MRQEVFRPLPVHLRALDEILTWCGEAAEAAGTRIDVELTVQDGTLHVWLGLDNVDVRAACDVFGRLLSPFRTPTAWWVTTMYCCACTAISRRLPSIPWPQRAWTPTSPGRWTGGGPLGKSPTGLWEHRTSSRTHEPTPQTGSPAPTDPSPQLRWQLCASGFLFCSKLIMRLRDKGGIVQRFSLA